MILLGLDPRSSGTRAVVVDEQGVVLSRATYPTADAAASATHDGVRPAAAGIVARGGAVAAVGTAVNPGAAIALAEEWTGAARGARHVIGFCLESSVYAGVLLDGRLFGGAHGLAGAAGWLALNPVEREDYRRLGCLEAEVGGAGIVRRLVWRVKAGDPSRAVDMAEGDLGAITAAQIFEAARAGDGVAVSVVRDTARYVGMAVANLVALLDPDVVVLGGALAEAGDLLLEPTRIEISRRVSPAALEQVAVVPAALGEDSAAIGAARAALLASRDG